MKRFLQSVIVAIALSLLSIGLPASAAAGSASLSLSPNQGAFDVGSTFEVSVFLNTGGNSVNAVDVSLKFTPDTLQVVSPTGGTSFVAVWVSQPTYSNTDGTIEFSGGLPSPGINTSAGKVSTITFRAKAPGAASVEILPSSKVLLNDGKGTNVLSSVDRATYTLALPAPGGPTVFSPTHPDQNAWYRTNDVTFSWKPQDGVTGYSWWFDEDPSGYADDKVDGTGTSTSYSNVASGIWFFHIKAQTGSVWGAPSSYAVRIDNTPPAAFTPTVDPEGSRPGDRRVVTFTTTDQHSGIDHYEVEILNLDARTNATPFFTEQASPWLTPALGVGHYRLVVRAYDQAGNWQDGTVTIENDQPPSTVLAQRLYQDGVRVNQWFIPWWVVLAFVALLLVFALVALVLWRRQHRDVAEELKENIERARHRLETERQKVNQELQEEGQISDLLQRELHDLKGNDKIDPPPHV